MKLSEILKNRMKELQLSADDIAEACNVNRATVYRWLNGEVDNMKRSSIAALATKLNLDPAVIVGNRSEDESASHSNISKNVLNSIRIPLYSTICCGNGGFVDDEIMDYISLPPEKLNPHKEYFAQVASGNSMINAGIHPGDILVFEKTSSVDDGDIGCFCIDDNEAMCKRYRLKKDKNGHIVQIVLVPDNPDVVKYPPVVIDVETQHFRTIGKLVYCIMDMKGR